MLESTEQPIGPITFFLNKIWVGGDSTVFFEVCEEYSDFPSCAKLIGDRKTTQSEYDSFIENFWKTGDLRLHTNLTHVFSGLDAMDFLIRIIPLDELPLHINVKPPLENIVKWRFTVGK